MKDILVRAKGPPVQKNEGFCGPYKKSKCEICEHFVSSDDSFQSIATQRTYFKRPTGLKFSFENVVCLFTCKACSKQYTGNTRFPAKVQ